MFEYLVERIRNTYIVSDKELENHLNLRGKDGWELVDIRYIENGVICKLVFKRVKHE